MPILEDRTRRVESDYSTSTATRFLYHPQVLQTVWGTLADPHRGHRLRDGAANFHAPAMWLRPFILDFFFFGTATATFSS